VLRNHPDEPDSSSIPLAAGGERDTAVMAIDVDPTARAVGLAGVALIGGSVVGGVVSVVTGVNTWANAWTAQATLAAPRPMLLMQAAATAAAVQRRRSVAMVGSGVLAAAAVVSGISGFFDGQLGREDLGSGHVVAQLMFVTIAWATAVVAALRLWRLRRILAGEAR
jgi:hypothetical protein